MSQSLQAELERIADPVVAAAITEQTRSLGERVATVISRVAPHEVGAILALVVRTMLAEVKDTNKSTAQPAPASAAKVPVPAEVIEQALRDFDDKATVEEVRRLRESGGLALGDFYGELEQLARSGNSGFSAY